MKSKLEIIDETVAYYSEDTSRRATVGPRCLYQTLDGRKCAVGRYMISPPTTCCGTVGGLEREYGPINDLLKDEYRGHSIYFWRDLQRLHDDSIYWDTNRLSEAGEKEVVRLKNKYSK